MAKNKWVVLIIHILELKKREVHDLCVSLNPREVDEDRELFVIKISKDTKGPSMLVMFKCVSLAFPHAISFSLQLVLCH